MVDKEQIRKTMSTIHPTAIIENGAKIGNDVTIGPYAVIGPNVVLHDG